MKIPVIFGYITILFESNKPMPWTIRKAVKSVLFVNGKATKTNRIKAIKKLRELTGCGLVDAVKYTNKFFPKSERLKV